MNRRRALALGTLVAAAFGVLVSLAGCFPTYEFRPPNDAADDGDGGDGGDAGDGATLDAGLPEAS